MERILTDPTVYSTKQTFDEAFNALPNWEFSPWIAKYNCTVKTEEYEWHVTFVMDEYYAKFSTSEEREKSLSQFLSSKSAQTSKLLRYKTATDKLSAVRRWYEMGEANGAAIKVSQKQTRKSSKIQIKTVNAKEFNEQF
uniref:Replication protein n=1 Tax=Panagrolaimus sp. ES5 TaxID=591445 RepID=A0AC34GKK8_9BILA